MALPKRERAACGTVAGWTASPCGWVRLFHMYGLAPHAALAWFADSDEGWFPNDNHPAIEIRRDSRRSTDLILNLASGPVTLDRPRKIVFGLQATPVKPLTPGWRANRWTFDATFHDFVELQLCRVVSIQILSGRRCRMS